MFPKIPGIEGNIPGINSGTEYYRLKNSKKTTRYCCSTGYNSIINKTVVKTPSQGAAPTSERQKKGNEKAIFIFIFFNHFYFPAFLVGGFTLNELLDKPWSQVSTLLPPGTCL